jgi:hypothetical protein
MNSIEIEPIVKEIISWFPFEKQVVSEAPREVGVYILRLAEGKLFGRLRGASDILYVGSSTCQGGLRQRLSHYFHPGPSQWTNLRINKYLSKYKMEVAWFPTSNPLNLEHKLLTQYESDHDEQPPFNHADTRRFLTNPSESGSFVDHLRITKVEGKE